MTALLSIALKGAVVVLAAALGTRLLHRAPASTRHGIWAVAFAALVLLPVLEMAGPRWSVGVLPAPAAPQSPPAPPSPPSPPAPPALPVAPLWTHADEAADLSGVAFEPEVGQEFEREMVAFEHDMETFDHEMDVFDDPMQAFGPHDAAVAPRLTSRAPPGIARRVPRWLMALWSVGALAVGLGWLAACLAAHRIVGRARVETDAEWNVTAERARRLSGLTAPVRLLRSDALDVPIAWGWGRGAVVLPPDADHWDEDRREAVLLHELAHLARRDAWTQAVAQAALAVHWINPLAWWGYRRFLDAREQACDDAVLRGGAQPSAYAAHLVGVARAVRRDRLALAAVAAMARAAPIESRVVSILDPVRQRRPLGRGAVAATVALAAAVCMPLAALQPVAQAPPAPLSAPDWTAVADTLDRLYLAPADSLSESWDEVDRAVETARDGAARDEAAREDAAGGGTAEPAGGRVRTAVSEARRDVALDGLDLRTSDEIAHEVDQALADADRDLEDAIADIQEQIDAVRHEGGPEASIRMQALRAAQHGLAQIDRQALRDQARAAAHPSMESAGRASRAVWTSPPSPPPPPSLPSSPSTRARPAPPAPPAPSVDWSDVDRARQAAQRRRSQ